MASQVFTKRSGTSDQGHDFEYYFIANLLLKLITDDDVEDFFLSSDDNDYGSFDDVVVEILYRSGHRQMYAIQLKHLEQRNLTVASLESDKGKFAIKNYFENFNFQNDYTAIILYTNASLQVTNGQVLNLGNLGKTNIWKTSLESVLTTYENGEFYYLGTENSTDFRNFCQHFSLYTNQANVTQLEKQTRDSFEKLFGCKESAFTEYVNFVIKWCKIKGKKEKLTKEWIRNVIAVCILKPFVQPLSFSSKAVNENTKVLRKAISLFQTTVFNSGCYEKVRELWSDLKQELTNVKRINLKYSVTSDFIESVDDLDGREKETSILLWLLDKCPLILAEAPEVYRAIEVFQEKKFIIFNPKMRLQSNSVFEKLSDLESYSIIYENIINKFTCSLQGKEEVTLKSLFHGGQDIGEFLTTNELLQMIDGPLIIGGGVEVLPACHVPRRISKNVVNTKFLQQLENDTLIIIDSFPNITKLKKDGEFYVTTIKEFLETETNKENEVYLCKGKCSRADVEKLCRKTNKIKYYHFCYLSETLLEYISSSNLDEIKCLVEKEHCDNECGLYQNDNDINIICANPGMGKTTLMKSLKNKLPSSLWTALIYARNYSSYFRKKKTNIHDFLNYCLFETGKNISIFDQNVIRLLMNQKRIVIVWDGLDELVEENLEIVKKLIHDAKVQGYQQWVTSRNHLKSTLEDEFNTLSRSLEEFDEKEQKMYINERLDLGGQEVDDIFTKIQKNIALLSNNNILGIPLQSFMLTELFLQDKEKYLNLLNEIFSLADLYEHFVAEKFNVYYKEKENLLEINESQRKRIERDKKTHVNSYEVAAIHTYFDKKIVSQLQTDFQNLSLILEEDLIGFVINTTNDGLSEFCHNSFGEYFAALYLTKNHSDFFVTFDLLFEAKYDNIRLFYDLISAKGCKGHISVLYRNYELLTTCTDDEIRKTDKFGRSTLEVACSWRKKYPLLQVTKDKLGNFELRNKLPLETTNDIPNLQKIISFLVTHFTLEQNRYDLFLNENLLLPFVSLKKDDIEKCSSMGENYTINVLLFAVALDFVTIFSFFENIPFIYCTQDYLSFGFDHNLLTISLQYKSINCLQKVVFYEPYKMYISENTYVLYNILSIFQSNSLIDMAKDVIKNININISSGLQQHTLLHHACSDNNHEVTSWLLENEASISSTDRFDNSPLHVACRNGNYDIVKLLTFYANSGEMVAHLLERSPVNHKNVYDETCLHIACRNGFVSIAELLLEKNAMINERDRHGKMPIHYASLSKNGELLTLLIENGADINAKDNEGNTPLHLACESYPLTKILIDNGADLSAINNDGKYVVHLTSGLEVLNLLKETGVNLNSKDTNGRMLIHYVCSNEHDYSPEFLDVLIENTSDVNATDNAGLMPLHHLCLKGVDPDLSQEFLSESLYKSLTSNIKHKRSSPVYDASSKSKKSLGKGAGETTRNVGGSTAGPNKGGSFGNTKSRLRKSVHIDNYENKIQFIEKLISRGALTNRVDRSLRTPLHYACLPRENGSLELVKYLIKHSVLRSDINRKDRSGKTPLHYACLSRQNSSLELVEYLIKSGADVNTRDYDSSKTLLHYVCLAGENSSLELVAYLIKSGADINSRIYRSGETPLHYACLPRKNSSLKLVEYLIKSGADINSRDHDNDKTPLHYACLPGENSSLELVEYLLKSGADINSRVYKSGETPLHYACLPRENSSLELVECLIKSGADINSRLFKSGETALHYACLPKEHSSLELVEYLIKSGADINSRDYDSGKTPLHYACLPRESSSLELVEYLIKSGANINSRLYNSGETPLHYACLSKEHSSLELVKYLIKSGADINSRLYNSGETPLHYACLPKEHSSLELVEYLIKSGADINSRDHDSGKTPLHYACLPGENSSLELVEYLLKSGADINSRVYKSGETPLHYACLPRENSSLELVECLIKSGADINSRLYKSGETALHYACLPKEHSSLELVEYLIKSGADINSRDYDSGKTPLHYACLPRESSSLELVEYLIKSGADINSRLYNSGETPLHYACLSKEHSSLELVEYLIKSGADINSRLYDSGKTPLHYASQNNQSDIVTLLIANGANTNI